MVFIKDDVYGVLTRIRSLDRDYNIVYDNGYFVEFKGKKILKIPYSQLDKRAVDFVYKTRIGNIDINNIEENNMQLQNNYNKEIEYISKYKLKEQLVYLENHDKIDYNTSNTTIWI